MEYEAVIGLEVHVQLCTESKLFCSCPNHFGATPNENVCPVCSGMPGALPAMNGKVIEYAAKLGMAVNATINPESRFARKNYFYPDLPKAYQISQHEPPICSNGYLDVETANGTRRVRIIRIHMEEDAGKNIHSAQDNASYVDLNRGGTPLLEIVSAPDLRSGAEAAAYLKALRAMVMYLKISDGNMEEGSFRCDANVSIRPKGQSELGTRTELKNLNSFKNVQRAIEYEIMRQQDVLEDGDEVIQETRLYDASKNITMSMRSKEDAHDYRYFPDPDLLPIHVSPEMLAAWRAELPEMPLERCARFVSQYGLSEEDAALLTSESEFADYFEDAVKTYPQPKRIANLMMGELLRELNQREATLSSCRLAPSGLAELAKITDQGLISTKIGHDIFPHLFESGESPEAYAKRSGMVQISDSGAIEGVVDEVIAENPKEVAEYKAGKTKLSAFFVGQVMRKTKGKANPALVNELLAKKLLGQ